MARMSLEERFWSKVNKNGPVVREDLGPCWVWTGCLREGYGAFSVGGRADNRLVGAHIIAYRLTRGEIPKGQSILHKCDNRACVRHIEAGSQSKNLKDCVMRGRHVAPKGEKNGMSLLTAQMVSEIRSKFSGKRGDLTRLAREFGVAVPTIHGIVNRNSWK